MVVKMERQLIILVGPTYSPQLIWMGFVQLFHSLPCVDPVNLQPDFSAGDEDISVQ
jgi:hypothetical protein